MSGRITVISPEGQRDWTLAEHNSLGRHPSNSIQVLDRIVSKEHCHIDLVRGVYFLRDLGSLNGTYVNGERVSERALHQGDEITMGATRIIVHVAYGREESFTGRPTAPAAVEAVRAAQAVAEIARAPQPPPRDPPPLPQPATAPGLGAGLPPLPAPTGRDLSKVTISPGVVESHIRTKLMPLAEQSFLPEGMIQDAQQLRRDYEKLRVSYDLSRAIGVELDVDSLLAKILDRAFDLLPADRGVVLMYDENADLSPRCVRTKRASAADEPVHLSTTIINEVLRDRVAVLSNDASVDARFSGAHSIIMQGIRSSMAVPLLYGGELFGLMLLDSQIAANAFQEKDLQLFQNVANQAAIAIQNSLYAKKLQAEALTRERFQRLLSPAIAEQVISGKVEVKKGGELRQTTMLFSDIRGFTTMSESRSPQEIVDMLNEYFELMVEIVFKYEGTLDKFVGDEIMALYGSPVRHEDDAVRAVRSALDMLAVLDRWNEERKQRGAQAVQIGIGINSGEVVAGYLGSSRALEYTVIGDAVNTGSRLCSAAKPGQILISEETERLLGGLFDLEELPAMALKGKSRALRIFAVRGERGVTR